MKFNRKKGPYGIDSDRLDYKNREPKQSGPVKPEARRRMLMLIGNTVLAFVLYFGLTSLEFTPILFIYPGVAAVLILVYVIYNQGFVYRNIRPDQLPDSLSPVEKTQLLQNAALRKQKSDWMLMLFIPLLITCTADLLLFAVSEWMDALNIHL